MSWRHPYFRWMFAWPSSLLVQCVQKAINILESIVAASILQMDKLLKTNIMTYTTRHLEDKLSRAREHCISLVYSIARGGKNTASIENIVDFGLIGPLDSWDGERLWCWILGWIVEDQTTWLTSNTMIEAGTSLGCDCDDHERRHIVKNALLTLTQMANRSSCFRETIYRAWHCESVDCRCEKQNRWG